MAETDTDGDFGEGDGDDSPDACDDGVGMENGPRDVYNYVDSSSKKRVRDEASSRYKSKAHREKLRRDKLNDRFLELSAVLNSSSQSKLDKASILSDAARMLADLRSEAIKLKDSNEKLQEGIKNVKVRKNELREEKASLKAEKEQLEQQLRAKSIPPTTFVPANMLYQPAVGAAASFGVPHDHVIAGKAVARAYHGTTMWQWLPHGIVDTTQDPKLWPPNA